MVTPEATTRAVLARMREHGRGSVVVCRDGALVGIFTERDAVRLLAARADLGRPVEQVMNARPETVAATESMADAMTRMRDGGYRRLPVLEADGRIRALLKVTGIIRYLVEYVPDAVYNLPPRPEPQTAEREGP